MNLVSLFFAALRLAVMLILLPLALVRAVHEGMAQRAAKERGEDYAGSEDLFSWVVEWVAFALFRPLPGSFRLYRAVSEAYRTSKGEVVRGRVLAAWAGLLAVLVWAGLAVAQWEGPLRDVLAGMLQDVTGMFAGIGDVEGAGLAWLIARLLAVVVGAVLAVWAGLAVLWFLSMVPFAVARSVGRWRGGGDVIDARLVEEWAGEKVGRGASWVLSRRRAAPAGPGGGQAKAEDEPAHGEAAGGSGP